MPDTTTALERLNARASEAHASDVRVVSTRRCSLEELAHLLALDALPLDLVGFRRRGRAREDGVGFVVTELPFGGSVIEGYHESFTAVTERGVVVRAMAMDEMGAEPDDTLVLEGEAEAVRAIEQALEAHG